MKILGVQIMKCLRERKVYSAVCMWIVSVFFPMFQITAQAQDVQPKGGQNSQMLEKITIAGGCFWCMEAIFQRVRGVEKVESGYSGGREEESTYEQVSTGQTGHAEAIQITFAPKEVSLETLLEVFFHLHDPTTLNRQGADVGRQYRSAIFYADEIQKQTAESVKAKISAEKLWTNPIVTEIVPFQSFYVAEQYHQNYYNQHTTQGYCSMVIAPKIQKLFKEFKEKLK